ncbi:MAG: NAD(+) synthase [Clostridiales bacterium]|nr:NAD(+) synthase [Clostridiales bacterium]
MHYGFIRTAAASPRVYLADTASNINEIRNLMQKAEEKQVELLVLPEMCITGATIGDLVFQNTLLTGALNGLKNLCEASKNVSFAAVVGLPFALSSRIFNCAAVIKGGKVLGLVPMKGDLRYFAAPDAYAGSVRVFGEDVPFGRDLIFACENDSDFTFAVASGEDAFSVSSEGNSLALAGASIIACPACACELAGRAEYRRMMLGSYSARLTAGCVYACPGKGESVTDCVYSGHSLIFENGRMLAESRWQEGLTVSEIDCAFLMAERRRRSDFAAEAAARTIFFPMEMRELSLTRHISAMPFIPEDEEARTARCAEILHIQAAALAQRLMHTHAKCAVIGVSGGLDSTLALIAAARALDIAELDRKALLAVTMPCFGTTSRTRNNALKLAEGLGATLMEVNIGRSVLAHFEDIGHSPETHDVTFENSQARERTQVLMDLANRHGGFVVGTGDLSELALGWATYNGDHMSMYGVNGSIPKTLIRHVVRYAADTTDNAILREALLDVLDTPVSPELLPPVDGDIAQKTEDIVGPYELHDFMLYHLIRRGDSPEKAMRLAQHAFKGQYDDDTIRKWLKTFVRRFFAQQFKRSCLPDGAKVGTVSFSPRSDWKMPSDASGALWAENAQNC